MSVRSVRAGPSAGTRQFVRQLSAANLSVPNDEIYAASEGPNANAINF